MRWRDGKAGASMCAGEQAFSLSMALSTTRVAMAEAMVGVATVIRIVVVTVGMVVLVLTVPVV